MPDPDDLEARLDRLESVVALQRLVSDYCVGADARDAGRWEAVWTKDAVWEAGQDDDHIFRGLDAIRSAVETQWRTFPRMRHATANHSVQLDGDRATGRCDVVVMVQLPDRRWLVGGGTYEDEYRREGGSWRMSRRRVVHPFELAPLADSDGPLRVEEPVIGE